MKMDFLQALMVTLVSMGIVFLVLIFLWAALEVIHKIVTRRASDGGNHYKSN